MHIYKIMCKVNKKSYIGLSEIEPDIDYLDLPKSILADIDDFGKEKFNLLKICELRNKEKAEFKAEVLSELEKNLYEEDEPESEETEFFAEEE